jgi:cell division protein FtsB
MKEKSAGSRGPRPFVALLWSLLISAFVLALLLVSDPRLLDLKKARAEVRELDRKITETERENAALQTALQAAERHDFPAEKAAREELQLVRSDEVVLLYPKDSLSGTKTTLTPGARTPTPVPTEPR